MIFLIQSWNRRIKKEKKLHIFLNVSLQDILSVQDIL